MNARKSERFDRFSALVVETWERTETYKLGRTERFVGGGKRNKIGAWNQSNRRQINTEESKGREWEKKLFSVQHCALQYVAEILMLLQCWSLRRGSTTLCIINMHTHTRRAVANTFMTSTINAWVQRSQQTRGRHVAHTCSELASVYSHRQIIKRQMQGKLRKSLVVFIVQFSLVWRAT